MRVLAVSGSLQSASSNTALVRLAAALPANSTHVRVFDRLTENQPVAVIDMTPQLNVPLIGLFGNDDMGRRLASWHGHLLGREHARQ
jgi:hypothetical protein